MRYILWDWNGTLLDDTRAALDTLNLMLIRRGAKPIGMGFYRDNFAFPVRPFYERIGMVLEHENWDELAREYHRIYEGMPKRLNGEAVTALERVRSVGAGQSVISALRQDLLDRAVAEFGVARYMECVYGVDNLDGASKLDRALELMTAITAKTGGVPPEVTMIGDAIHDKAVADALGAKCVLCAQGSHSARRLSEVAPTGGTLLEAVEIALGGGG